MPKRGLNIYKRKDGRWEGRIARIGQTGYYSVYGKSYSEVKKKMENWKQDKSQFQTECTMTVEELILLWMDAKKNFWKPTTYSTYKQLAERHIFHDIGKINAQKFDSRLFTEFIIQKKAPVNHKSLSDRYLRNITSIVMQSYIYANAKLGFQLTIPQKPEIHCPRNNSDIPDEHYLEQLEKYLLQHTNDSFCLGILLAFHTGIRIGELCALQWQDLDLHAGIMRISKTTQRIRLFGEQQNKTEIIIQDPKTFHSKREIPLPNVLIEILAKHQRASSAYLIQGKKRPYTEPRTVQYRFQSILHDCDLESFNFHMLRHAFATRCIQKGFDVKSLSEILGHSNTQITLNLYVHSTMQQKRNLMNMLIINSRKVSVG